LHAKTENQGMLLLGFQVVFQLKSQWSCAWETWDQMPR
jgi:hypothetical protein